MLQAGTSPESCSSVNPPAFNLYTQRHGKGLPEALWVGDGSAVLGMERE